MSIIFVIWQNMSTCDKDTHTHTGLLSYLCVCTTHTHKHAGGGGGGWRQTQGTDTHTHTHTSSHTLWPSALSLGRRVSSRRSLPASDTNLDMSGFCARPYHDCHHQHSMCACACVRARVSVRLCVRALLATIWRHIKAFSARRPSLQTLHPSPRTLSHACNGKRCSPARPRHTHTCMHALDICWFHGPLYLAGGHVGSLSYALV